MVNLVIKGGTVLDKSGSRKADVAIGEDGNISQISADIDGENIVDAAGCIVSSGLVDLNSHFCQPGNEEVETIESGTRSAVLGGYTAVMLMPHTAPVIDSAAAVKEMQSLRSEALCHIELSGSLTLDGSGKALSPIGEMAELGVRFFTHSNLSSLDLSLLRRAMEYSSRFNITIGVTPFVAGNGHMNEGDVSSDLGIRGVAIEEEEILIYQFVKMAKLTGARVHLQQITSPKAIEIISAAKADGVSVTCEVSPHHFALTDEEVRSYRSVYKVAPPLRSNREVKAIKKQITSGQVDAIATCHAPNPQHEIDLPFEEAPYGAIGLETAFAVSITELNLPLHKILSAMSWVPAEIAGIEATHGGVLSEGRPGNLIVIEEGAKWSPSIPRMASRSANSPFDGHLLQGKIKHTFVNGEAVVLDGETQR